MIKVKSTGSFDRILNFLKRNKELDLAEILDRHGRRGVDALMGATPTDTGTTAGSWSYTINQNRSETSISWHNTNTTKSGTPIVILLQYGHATGNGGYVQGYDFINPAIQPIFDKIADDVWREVRRIT